MSTLPAILNARTQHTATLIFLHGIGGDKHIHKGLGWTGVLDKIRPDYLKIVCPTAPSFPFKLVHINCF